jgi:hypothetical protein
MILTEEMAQLFLIHASKPVWCDSIDLHLVFTVGGFVVGERRLVSQVQS